MTRDDWILIGAGTLGLVAIGAIYVGKSNASLNPTVDPLYSGSEEMSGPAYMNYNAPKTYIPLTSTPPCEGCSGTTLFGSTVQLAQQMLGQASAVLANMRSV